MNAPQAGTITEFLVGEGDTVSVGQELAKLDAGAGGSGGEKNASAPAKAPASDQQATSSDPAPNMNDTSTEAAKTEESKRDTSSPPAPPKEEEPIPTPPEKDSKPPPPMSSEIVGKSAVAKDEKKPEQAQAGSRGENRVRVVLPCCFRSSLTYTGENEPYATEDSRASEAVPKYSRIVDNLQRG